MRGGEVLAWKRTGNFHGAFYIVPFGYIPI